MTYKPTEKELDEAMKGMECWQTMEHIKKCVKCQKEWENILAEEAEAQYQADLAGAKSKAEAESEVFDAF